MVGLLLGGALFVHPVSAFASSNFNDNAAGADFPTVRVMNHTQNPTCGSNCTWTSSISANPGDTVDFAIYYHNTGPDTAQSTRISVSPRTTAMGTSHIISGTVTASNANHTGNGSATVFTSASTQLNYVSGGVFWYPDKQTTTSPLQYSFTGDEVVNGGLNIGDILPPSSCSGYPSIQFCHQGYLIVRYSVAYQTVNPACTINYFNANPNSVNSGTSSSLSWSTSNCTSVSISPSLGSVPLQSSGFSTGALYSTTIFTLSASGSNGNPTATATVSVTPPISNPCTINYFTANPSSVSSGNSSQLSWSTSNCTNASIAPSLGSVPVQSTGYSTSPLYATTTFTLSAYGATGSPTATTIVQVNTQQAQCVINSFYASPTSVNQYNSSQLSWSTSNCTSASISSLGNVNPNSGSISTGSLSNTQTFTLSAYGNSGTPSQSVTVQVNNNCYNNCNCNNNCNNNSGPSVTTNNATNIADTYATLNGYINVGNNSQTTSYYFQYGTNQYNLYSTTLTQSNYNFSGPVSTSVYNLSPNTTYYFRLYASNNYGSDYGSILSFTTNGNVVPVQTGNLSVTTTVATSVGRTTARLNGLASNTDGASTVWFDYGTDSSVPFTTGARAIGYGAYQALSESVANLAPGTTYYYRISGSSPANGTVHGALAVFTTATASTTIFVNTSTGGNGNSNIMLKIETPFENVNAGNTVPFTVTYKNISGSTLKNAVLTVTLPGLLDFSQSSTGLFDNSTHAVTVRLGSLDKNEEGTMNVVATAKDPTGTNGSAVTTATMGFTLPSGAQDEAIAYAFNTVGSNSSLAGLALFGTGFFPTTFLGWLILILIIALIIALARRLYSRRPASTLPPPPQYNY